MSAGITAGARGASAGLGQASAGNARTPPRPRKPGLKSRIRGLETSVRAAVERRKASAPEADGSDRPWRAPRPKRGQVATSVRVVRPISFAPYGAPPPFFIWRRNISGFRSCCKTRVRRAPRERDRSYLPPPLSRGRTIGYALDCATRPHHRRPPCTPTKT